VDTSPRDLTIDRLADPGEEAGVVWLERWYDVGRTDHPGSDDGEVDFLRRFDPVLERDYAGHHDAGHHADERERPVPS
jgi:hypothetical protein